MSNGVVVVAVVVVVVAVVVVLLVAVVGVVMVVAVVVVVVVDVVVIVVIVVVVALVVWGILLVGFVLMVDEVMAELDVVSFGDASCVLFVFGITVTTVPSFVVLVFVFSEVVITAFFISSTIGNWQQLPK